jgi:RES domain-containing protein
LHERERGGRARREGDPSRALIALDVATDGVFDLRDRTALDPAAVDGEAAAAPWQKIVSTGGTPPSWSVARQIQDLGAAGLIDPSRTAPGLRHLVLWRWNAAGARGRGLNAARPLPWSAVSPTGRV